MSFIQARTASRAALAAAFVFAALAACSRAPDVAIVTPEPGATLGPALDLDAAAAGLQMAVDATTSAPDGSDATAIAGGPPSHATAQGGKIHFASVTFNDGAATLTVVVVDKSHDKVGSATANYSVDSFTRGCRISTPANHSSLAADPGDTGLVSVVVQAACRGLAANVKVGLLENDDLTPIQLQAPGSDGSVTFNADLIPGANTLSVVAAGVPYDEVEIELVSSRCRAEIEPPSGSVFNLAGTGGAVADLDPTTTGLQADVSVKTGCSDGSAASLSVSSNGTVQLTATSTVHGGVAVFPVTLPDGALDLQAFIGSPGTEGASRHAGYSSDGTAPAISVLAPVDGGLLGPQDNVGSGTQFVARIRGLIAGFNSGGYAALEIDQGTAQAMEIPVTPDLTSGIFSTDVALSPGVHQLYAKVVRASGNQATSAPIEFTVVINGTALVIVTPANGSEVGLSQLTPGTDSAQLVFALQSAGLIGAAVTVDCGSGLTGSSVIGSDGRASIPLSLPISSCAGALFRCTATSNGTSSTPVTFTADDTAPKVVITAPASGPTSGMTTAFQATTSCAGEGQIYTLDNGGTIISSGSVQNNTIDLASVALHAGQNQLHLTVTDAAGNSGAAEVDVTSATSVFPSVAFVTPLNGDVLRSTSALLDCTNQQIPVLKQVQISLTGDTVDASGLALKLTNSGGTQTLSQTPTLAGDIWTWSNVSILPETNTLALSATDAGGNTGQASVRFQARCVPLAVQLVFAVSGSNFGYAQDKDHTTPGVQVDAQVQAGAINGSVARLCSTALSAAPGGCVTAGTGALTVVAGTSTMQGGLATFTVTLPDGAQTVYAEVTDVGTGVSAGKALIARSTPPTVTSIALAEDVHGQTLNSGPDGALNQTELDAANGTVHFEVVFGPDSFVAGKAVQIFDTSSPTALGQATVAQNGDGVTATSVPVPTSALNTGGYQSYVFYALVSDDAGNKDSTPSAPVANVLATTLGTAQAPFVIAPTPAISLLSPAPGTRGLNASDDVRCSGGVCPNSDPLIYAFSASTSAPDSSTSGATSEITFLSGGVAIAPESGETNPTRTTGSAVADVDLPIFNGAAITLSARIEDPYGNVAGSAAATLLVDSVAPELAITTVEGQSAGGGTVSIDQPSVQAVVSIDATSAGTLEYGQGVAIYSDGALAGSAVYVGSSSGAGTVSVPIAISFGLHALVAKALDLAGNVGSSPAINVRQTYSGPTLALSQPAPVSGGTLWLGTSTESGSGANAICAPNLTFSTTNVPDGNSVLVWLVASGSNCGNPHGNVRTATVSNNQATLSSAPFAIADGDARRLCAQTSDNVGNTVQTTPQNYACDLQTPTVAWVSPAASSKFVAFGQTVAGATASTSSTNTRLGLASATFNINAPYGATLDLTVDQHNTPSVTTAQFVSCGIAPTSGTQTIYALAVNNCTTTAGTGQLLLPIDYAQLLAHTLTATLTAPSGNAAVPATQSVSIDVAEPAAVSPQVSLKQAIGVATVTIPTVPGDDQTVGGNPAVWEVRYAATALTASNWETGTLVTANLAGSFPTGVPSSFQVVLPAGNASLFLGVRAKDRVGNLGDLGAGSVVQLDTQPVASGSNISIKDDFGGPPTTASHFDETMRIADLDGDGYDDIILNYSFAQCGSDGYCNGRVIVYFGGAGGVSNSSAPLVLSGTIVEGFLGFAQSFDVGDFDADGLVDIAAAETDFATAHVLIWTGARISAWRKAGSPQASPPSPIVLSDNNNKTLVGGTVRAVGHITGGSGAGDDLAVSNYSVGDGTKTPYKLALLGRGGAWSSAGATNIFSSGSPATAFITLPDTVGQGAAPMDSSGVEAAPFTYVGASGDLPGLALSLIYPSSTLNWHELRLFGGDQIAANPTWLQGTVLPSPSSQGPSYPGAGANDLYGYYMVGGLDAVGDNHADLLVADTDNGALYLYDGASLLGPSVAQEPTSSTMILNSAAEAPNARISYGAVLVPDLDGDGKAEVSGAIDPSGVGPIDLWFGQTGDAVLPALSFFGQNCTPSAMQFCFAPPRGQHIQGAPVFNATQFGQAIGSGHVTSLVGRDLVILSQPNDSASQPRAPGTLILLR